MLSDPSLASDKDDAIKKEIKKLKYALLDI